MLLIISLPVSVFLAQNKQELREKAAPVEPLLGEAQQLKMMVIQYIPPGGVTSVYPEGISDTTGFIKNSFVSAMNNGTKFHGYSDASAGAMLNFTLADSDIYTINAPPPTRSDNPLNAPTKADNQPGYLDVQAIFTKYNICSVAKQKNIGIVTLLMADYGQYGPKGFEDYITGNKGIPTNGPILRGASYCDDKTIYVIAPVYTRGLAEALESYGHHLESAWAHFKYSEYIAWSDRNSCGNVHNPPNSRFEYDRENTASFQSDCGNWKVDGSGVKETLSCTTWGCRGAEWLIWWMQNVPTEWWPYIANPDGTIILPFPGDIDGNGRVDIFDYNILVGNFGKRYPDNLNGADLDNDGDVDIFDYNILVGNFGKTS